MSETAKDITAHQDLYALPDDWSWTPLGDICDAINGRAFKSTEWREAGVPIIRIQNLKNPNAPFNYFQGDLNENHQVRSGDLLFAWSGTPGTSFGAHIWRGPDAALNQHIFKVQFDRAKLDTKYFCYALNQNVSRYVEQAQGGVGLAHITKSKFMASMIPVAPLDQQKRIVAEIEKQFSRLDEAVANLKRVKANLKRYKAAVLKAAVKGRLVETEAELARREGRNYETGAQLLQRILETRRSQWQGKGRYKEPAAPDTTDLPELPEGWVWASPGQLSAGEQYSLSIGPFGSSLKVSDYANSGVPLVFVRNIRAATFGGPDTVYVSDVKADELRAHWVEAGDLLVTKMGDPPGDVCIYPTHRPPAVITADCLKLRLGTFGPTQFFAYAIESDLVHRQILGITKGVAQLKVSLGRFGSIAFPLPPTAEQHRIVSEVDCRLSLMRSVEKVIKTNLVRSEGLRQSILFDTYAGNKYREGGYGV